MRRTRNNHGLFFGWNEVGMNTRRAVANDERYIL